MLSRKPSRTPAVAAGKGQGPASAARGLRQARSHDAGANHQQSLATEVDPRRQPLEREVREAVGPRAAAPCLASSGDGGLKKSRQA